MKKERIALIVVSIALVISLIINIAFISNNKTNNKTNNNHNEYLIGTWKSNNYKLSIFKNNKFEYTYYSSDDTKINTIFGYLENNTLIYEKIRHYQIEGLNKKTYDKETTGYLYITKLSDKTINVYGKNNGDERTFNKIDNNPKKATFKDKIVSVLKKKDVITFRDENNNILLDGQSVDKLSIYPDPNTNGYSLKIKIKKDYKDKFCDILNTLYNDKKDLVIFYYNGKEDEEIAKASIVSKMNNDEIIFGYFSSEHQIEEIINDFNYAE